MGNHEKGANSKRGVGSSGRSKPKQKSIKTKALEINSKRKLARLGKRQKTGHAGVAVRYMTRSRAMRKLQMTLRDFRRLCILKGIYPREPKNKSFSKTCYHVKDISFLAHEPLLQHFADTKAYMKKVRRTLNRDNKSEALRLYEAKPAYTLEHLVRERYPRFSDSLADMDDALCLLHLFSDMRSMGLIQAERTENCLKLTREWQLYVVLSRSLRKSFVSVKGIYYQAEVMGSTITWIAPHKFSQDTPREVDYRVMSTFLEFYQSLMGFVLFKLYSAMGMRYPPRLDQALDASGAHLACIQPEPVPVPVPAAVEELAEEPDQEDMEELMAASDDDDEDESEEEEEEAMEVTQTTNKKGGKKGKGKGAQETAQQVRSKKRIQSLASKLRDIVQEPEETEEAKAGDGDGDGEAEDGDEEREVFAEDEQAQEIARNDVQVQAQTNLLRGLGFWLSREVPFEPLEFVIRAFGGDVFSEGSDVSPKDMRVTHFVSDRPALKRVSSTCEYVQPQWVFDSVNFRVRMPVGRYALDVLLPPHLSPFVDNGAVGYTPDFATEVLALQAAAGVAREDIAPKLLRDVYQEPAHLALDGEEDEDEEDDDDDDDDKEGKAKAKRKAKKMDADAMEEAAVRRMHRQLGVRDDGDSDSDADAEAEAEGQGEDESKSQSKAVRAHKQEKLKQKQLQQELKKKAKAKAKGDKKGRGAEQPGTDMETEADTEADAKAAKKKLKTNNNKSTTEGEGEGESESEASPAPAATTTTKKKKEKAEAPTFVASRKFRGGKKGYAFKLGASGVGYYLDVNAGRKITYKADTQSNRQRRLANKKKEEHDRRRSMMSSKAKRLYGKMEYGIKRKQDNAKDLERRKSQLGSNKKRRT